MLIKSLKEIDLDELKFPIFFQEKWLGLKNNPNMEIFLYIDIVNTSIIPFNIKKIKFLVKGEYLYKPLKYDGSELETKTEKLVLEKFHQFVAENNIADVLLPPPHFSTFRSIPSGCKYYELGNIIYNIQIKKGFFLEGMKANYRNEIRKLENFTNLKFFVEVNDFEKAYDLMKKTHDLQNKSFTDFNEFKSIKENLKGKFLLNVCELDGKTIGAVLFIYDNQKAYYLYSGNEKTKEYPGINKKLLLLAFQYFHNLSLTYVILGGFRNPLYASKKINDIQNFKLRFGSDIEKGYHFIKIIKPIKYFIFTILLKLKSKIQGRNLDLINLEGLEIFKS